MFEVIMNVRFWCWAIMLGVGATVIVDVWAIILRRWLGVVPLDFRYVGRWLGYLPHGILLHKKITQSAPVRGERFLGWGLHYVIGVAFAAMLLAVVGLEWVVQPTLLPAVLLGIITVVFPYFVLQPCLGAGVASCRTPKPNRARIKSLVTHLIFGIGLYLTVQLLVFVRVLID